MHASAQVGSSLSADERHVFGLVFLNGSSSPPLSSMQGRNVSQLAMGAAFSCPLLRPVVTAQRFRGCGNGSKAV